MRHKRENSTHRKQLATNILFFLWQLKKAPPEQGVSFFRPNPRRDLDSDPAGPLSASWPTSQSLNRADHAVAPSAWAIQRGYP